MIYIFHGENQAGSRTALQQEISKLRSSGVEILTLDGDKITPADLESSLATNNLFAANAFVIENLLSRLRSRAKDEAIALIQKYHDKTILLWEKKTATPANLSKFPQAKVFISKTPTALFTFLDAVYPGNLQSAQQLLRDAATNSEDIVIFTLLARQISQLIQVAGGASPKMAPWQATKLRGLAKHWTLEQLINFHSQLIKIDFSIKSGKSTMSYFDHLDILLLTLLR